MTKYGLDYFPNDSSCEQASILEENVRLKIELAKHSIAQCENALHKILSIQRRGHLKEGLGYVAKPKKKNHKKKAKPAQAKKNNVVGGKATRGKATHDDFAGNANPHYVLYCDYYGDVYAKYVGPYDGDVALSIWVPKTLVANKRGPIEKWVPKSKP